MSDMHKMNKNNIFDFVLTLPAEGSVFFILHSRIDRVLQGHRTENSILQIRECVYPIYTAQNVHFGWNEKVIGFVQSLKYYDSIVKKEAEKGIAAYSFSASFIYTY